MPSTKPSFRNIPKNERTPLIDALLELVQWQEQRISDLEDVIQDFKKETKKPKFESSKMDEKTEIPDDANKKKKKVKRKNKKNVPIHDEQIIPVDDIPEGARFKGYKDIVVQDIVIKPHNTRYRLAQYETQDGKYITAPLPKGITNKHWGSTLHSYILQVKLERHDVESTDKATFIEWLIEKGIKGPRHQKIILEGAMIGSLLRHGIPSNIAIISDDAGQFNVFDHALCWIHTERLVHRLIPLNDEHKNAVKFIRGGIWAIYKDLKAYKKSPTEAQKKQIEDAFFNLFKQERATKH